MGYINESRIIQMIRLDKIDNCEGTENEVEIACLMSFCFVFDECQG